MRRVSQQLFKKQKKNLTYLLWDHCSFYFLVFCIKRRRQRFQYVPNLYGTRIWLGHFSPIHYHERRAIWYKPQGYYGNISSQSCERLSSINTLTISVSAKRLRIF